MVHVEFAMKRQNLNLGQIEQLAVDPNAQSTPIGGIQHFGEVFGVSVFPPAHTGFIGVVNATDISPLQRMSAVGFFQISTLTHHAIAE